MVEHRERIGHLAARRRRAEREVAGGDRLRRRHDVALDAPVFQREPAPGAAEAGDDLVADQQHVVLVADRAHPGEVVVRRHLHAVALHHRLGDEGGDRLRPLVDDVLLQEIDAEVAHLRRVHAEGRAVEVGRGDAAEAGHAGLGDGAGAEIIGAADHPHGGAVIGVPARDDLVGAGLHALGRVVLLGELDRHLVRLRPAAREYRRGERAGRERGDPGREPDRDIGDVGEGAGIVERHELVVDRPRDALLPVAERARPCLRAHHVEIGLARGVGDLHPVGAREDRRAVRADVLLGCKREQVVVERVAGERVEIGGFHPVSPQARRVGWRRSWGAVARSASGAQPSSWRKGPCRSRISISRSISWVSRSR